MCFVGEKSSTLFLLAAVADVDECAGGKGRRCCGCNTVGESAGAGGRLSFCGPRGARRLERDTVW